MLLLLGLGVLIRELQHGSTCSLGGSERVSALDVLRSALRDQ